MSYPNPSQQPQQPQWQPLQPGQGFPTPQPEWGPGAPTGHPGGHVPPGGGGRGSGRNRWLIPVAAATAVAVMAGTVWASISLVNFGGPQPETVLPGNSVAFGKVDLSIDGNQAIELLSFLDQLPDEITDEMDDTDGEMNELFADVFTEIYPDTRKSSVEEWIGDRVGGAVWPTDNTNASEDTGVAGAVALSVENERLAEEEFDSLSTDQEMDYEVVPGFVLISYTGAALSDLHEQVDEHGTLEDAETFSSDMNTLPSGSLASTWTDYGAALEVEELAQDFQTDVGAEPVDLEGRMTASLRVDGDYLEVRSDLLELHVDGEDMSWLSNTSNEAVDAIGQLPESSVAAIGASGMDTALSEAYDNGSLDFVLDDRDFQMMESDLNSIGAHLPEGFGALLGSTTAYGITGMDGEDFFQGTSEVPFEYRAVGGDEEVLNDFVSELIGDPFAQPPGVNSDGDDVVVTRGSAPTGVLGDDPVFQQTMQEMDDSFVAGYVDLRQILEQDRAVDVPEQWGAFGVAVSVTEEGERITGELRWAPSGGE